MRKFLPSLRSTAYRLCLVMSLLLVSAPAFAQTGDAALDARRKAMLDKVAKQPLAAEQNPETWVDVERWSVAHACLATNTRLDEANKFFATVTPVSLWHGLVADTDVQVTDLLRTYFEFRNDARLRPEAKKHLEDFFRAWVVPNSDRNGRADVEYEWPAAYTENHSLNILVAAYLIDHALDRDAPTKALRKRLMERFLADRSRYGWSEYHSPQYGLVTAKTLTLLADVAPDKSVADGARLSLDLLAIEWAAQCTGPAGGAVYRGTPFVRGAGRESNNANDAFYGLSRYWFDDSDKQPSGDQFMVHLLTSKYRPPAVARELLADFNRRGRYTMAQTMTTGAARLRAPVLFLVTPVATMSAAQGSGRYYQGNYWSVSFASAPGNVITGRYHDGRSLFQHRNVMAAFGEVNWHGALKPAEQRDDRGAMKVGGDGAAFAAQVILPDSLSLVVLAEASQAKDAATFASQVRAMQPAFENGVVRWTSPEGEKVEAKFERDGDSWRFVSASINGKPWRVDRNMLYDSPWLVSVRGSGVARVVSPASGAVTVYDYSKPDAPRVGQESAKSAARPAENLAGHAGMEFVYVEPGEFAMGSAASVGRASERPQRWVTVDGFYMSRTEVTVAQYKAFLAENASVTPPPAWVFKDWAKTDQHAMTWVNWSEATAFCDWLTKKTGKKHRLPTEAEWERAAKGFDDRAYPWGNDYENAKAGTPNGEYAPVGSKPADVSPFGVADMAGGVWEWCADWYDAKAYEKLPSEPEFPGYPVPWVSPAQGTQRSLRGCGWNFDPETFRTAYRSRLEPDARSPHIGFRVVREP